MAAEGLDVGGGTIFNPKMLFHLNCQAAPPQWGAQCSFVGLLMRLVDPRSLFQDGSITGICSDSEGQRLPGIMLPSVRARVYSTFLSPISAVHLNKGPGFTVAGMR